MTLSAGVAEDSEASAQRHDRYNHLAGRACAYRSAVHVMALQVFYNSHSDDTALQIAAKPARITHAALLAATLKLDMTAWFTPTAGNYFGNISKAAIIEVLREIKGDVAPAWNGMKKNRTGCPCRT